MSTPAANQGQPPPTRRRFSLPVFYCLLVVASLLWQYVLRTPANRLPDDVESIVLESRESAPARPSTLAFRQWHARGVPDSLRPPVVLIHGVPGDSSGFTRLATILAARGYRVIAPDLPGAGASDERAGLSLPDHARAVLRLLDSLHVNRAHIVGWGRGAAVGITLAGEQPHRVASLTMIGGMGVQSTEGSGSYAFEHVKYAGAVTVLAAADLLPHFGLLGSLDARTAWARTLLATDQRPLRSIMSHLGDLGHDVPVLILHGRDDAMVPWRAAVAHHDVIRQSSLVIIPGGHRLPAVNAREVAVHLHRFIARHASPGVPPERETLELAPVPPRRGLLKVLEPVEAVLRSTPWWGQTSLIGKVTLVLPVWGVVACALAVGAADVDFFVAFVGAAMGLIGQTSLLVLLGWWRGERVYSIPYFGSRLPRVNLDDWRRRMRTRPAREAWLGVFVPARRATSLIGATACGATFWQLLRFTLSRMTASVVWALVAMISAQVGVALAMAPLRARYGLLGDILGLGVVVTLAKFVPQIMTHTGRRHAAARVARWLHHEYWPMWLLYAPVVVFAWFAGHRRGGFNTVTCVNPGITPAGGWVGESKHAIMRSLGKSPLALRTELIPESPPEGRLRRLDELMATRPELASFPLVLKPDQGERGHAFHIARSREDADAYLRSMMRDAVVQPYHPGPFECAVRWLRTPGRSGGTIFSVTRKELPVLTGDGKRSLEDLVWDHPRHSRLAEVILERLAHDASRVPAAGEVVHLGMAGNHCQGATFRDWPELATPALARALDELAQRFEGGLDAARFDIRYADEEALCQGRDFAIVEVNGTTGESTNIYDPSHGFVWAYAVLFRHWGRLYALGAERRREGVRPITVRQLLAMLRRHARAKRGSSISD